MARGSPGAAAGIGCSRIQLPAEDDPLIGRPGTTGSLVVISASRGAAKFEVRTIGGVDTLASPCRDRPVGSAATGPPKRASSPPYASGSLACLASPEYISRSSSADINTSQSLTRSLAPDATRLPSG